MTKKLISLALFAAFAFSQQGCTPPSGTSESSSLEVPLSQEFAKISIATDGGAPIDSKDVYVNGTLNVDQAFSAPMKIRGRGNSTWNMPKKPFKIKLNTSSSVLGMPADKEWVLLANYSDKTLMRNELAFEMGRRLKMAYVPRTRTVEVNLNGTELGTYILTEQIKVSSSRVNVTASDLTGGYLIELDRRLDGTYFTTSRSNPYVVKEPSSLSTDQMSYISSYVQQAEDALYGADFADPLTGYAKFIDVDSFIDFYLVNEIAKNVDAANFSSIYFYKDVGGKLVMGPLWDFDLGFGNCDYADAQFPTGWWLRTGSPWFTRLFQDPAFEARVKVRWNQLRNKSADLNSLLKLIDRQAYALELVQAKNFTLWDILNIYVWPNRVVTGSYAGEVAAMKDWLTTRMNWLESQFNP